MEGELHLLLHKKNEVETWDHSLRFPTLPKVHFHSAGHEWRAWGNTTRRPWTDHQPSFPVGLIRLKFGIGRNATKIGNNTYALATQCKAQCCTSIQKQRPCWNAAKNEFPHPQNWSHWSILCMKPSSFFLTPKPYPQNHELPRWTQET